MSWFLNWSHSLRRTFVKDYAIPVSVVQDPYFEYQIDFLDKQYNTWEKVALLEEALARFKDEEELNKYMRETREAVIDGVKSSHAYEGYCSNTAVLPFAQMSWERKVPDKCVYKLDNVGLRMVSIDLVSANFQVFKLFWPELVNHKDSYEGFISQFTDLEYFKKSKKIRQVIFGNLCPKRQARISKDVMFAMWQHFEQKEMHLEMRMLSADEIVFREVTHLVQHPLLCIEAKLSDMAFDKKKVEARVQEFTIEPVKMRTSSAYIKRYPDGSFDLKCCPGPYTIEVLRHIYGQPSHPYDKVFYNDGRLCEYKDSLF